MLESSAVKEGVMYNGKHSGTNAVSHIHGCVFASDTTSVAMQYEPLSEHKLGAVARARAETCGITHWRLKPVKSGLIWHIGAMQRR
jgi:hypothetical protein